jgi:hypothetical protein
MDNYFRVGFGFYFDCGWKESCRAASLALFSSSKANLEVGSLTQATLGLARLNKGKMFFKHAPNRPPSVVKTKLRPLKALGDPQSYELPLTPRVWRRFSSLAAESVQFLVSPFFLDFTFYPCAAYR